MKKITLWGGVTFLFIFLIAYFGLYGKITVAASHIGSVEQGWMVHFSKPISEKSVKQGALSVIDENGHTVSAEMIIKNNGQTLHIKGLKKGSYTLKLDKEKFNQSFLTSLESNEIKFELTEPITSIQSAKELEDYFEVVRKAQQSRVEEFEMKTMQEIDVVRDTSAPMENKEAYSTTNVQVEGIDESDIVKTDGDYIYAITEERKVTISNIQNPQNMQIASKIETNDFIPTQLFLEGDTLIVLGMQYEERTSKEYWQNELTVARLYDVTNKKQPVLLREIGSEGSLTGARKISSILYFITSMQPNYWQPEPLVGDELRPKVLDTMKGQKVRSLDYEALYVFPGSMEPTYSIITAVNVSNPLTSRVNTKGYLGASEQMYMSPQHLYLTATQFDYEPINERVRGRIGLNPVTCFYQFGLTGTDVQLKHSATVPGTVLNQFSMDEYEQHFRVVMTEGNVWDERRPSQNHLYIFDEQMKQVGTIKGLAKGERIYAARFMGNKAYMVTFRETDPLFVLDVQDPKKPKVLGELKIPGFSNYLHPLDEHHLIGFGYETAAEKSSSGGPPIIRTKGMKISLFDVSDVQNPIEKDVEIIGGSGTYSPLQNDHKALFQHREQSLFGFPVVLYDEEKEGVQYQGAGALIYKITPSKGIELKGNLVTPAKKNQQYEEWDSMVQRIVYRQDYLFTISPKELNSFSLHSFEQVDTMKLDE